MPVRSLTATIPAPTGGWNARDSLDTMPPNDAVYLQNLFPTTSAVELRAGFSSHSTSVGSGAVEFLCEYAHEDGTRHLISAGGGSVYNSSAAAAATSLGSGFSSNKWQAVNFKNYLIMVNGTDQPQSWDGTTLAAANYTGIADDSVFIDVNVYKSRLYFVENNSSSIWYAGSSTVTGAVTEFNVGDQLRYGGSVVYAGSYTQDTGAGVEDIFVVVTDRGEILLYAGTYPGDGNWTIIGRFYTSDLVGRRAVSNIDSDLVIITEDGVVMLSALLAGGQSAASTAFLTNKITDAFRSAVKLYGSNYGWEVCSYPRGQYGLVNVPKVTSGTAEQYVVNLQTGAWCSFTGQNAVTWSLYNQSLYFGGTDGTVYKADSGTTDNGARIATKAKMAFNYFEDRSRIKQFTMIRPLILGDQTISLTFGVDIDFEAADLTDIVTLDGSTGSDWDTAEWDLAPWDSSNLASQDWYSISGIGRCAAIKFAGDYGNASFSLAALSIMYQPGGYI